MRSRLWAVLVILVVLVLAPQAGWAGPVGAFTLAEGSVELLRQGRLPALRAKVRDPVEPGDLIRTKSEARAQVQFLDDSVLVIAPGSSVTIEAYAYERAAGQREAVLKVLRGLVHCTVTRLIKTARPDFLLKTHTAVLGVRGTRWFTLLGARYSAFFNELGTLEVGSSAPEITRKVILLGGETTTVPFQRPPTPPRRYPDAFRAVLRDWLQKGVPDWVISLDPLLLPWLDQGAKELPSPRLEKLPEGLFVPPRPTLPAPQEPLK